MSYAIIKRREILVIETPERVELEFALASIGNRFLAVALDHFIQYFSMFIIAWIFLGLAGISSSDVVDAPERMISEMPKWTLAVMILVLFVLFSGYFIFFEWFWNGQTPGKRLLRLRVIRDDGRPITIWESITRNLLRICDAVPGFVVPVYSVGLIAIFLSDRDQRVGDLFAGTVVVRERASEAPSFTETFASRPMDAAYIRVQKPVRVETDITRLDETEAEVIEAFLRRQWDMPERQRLWMAWRIALPVMYKLRPSYDVAEFTYEGFLEELLHRYAAKQRSLH